MSVPIGINFGAGVKAITVATDAERFALTANQVNGLDWVKVLELTPSGPAGAMERAVYGVIDNTLLATAGGWVHLGFFILIPQNTVAPSVPSDAYVGVALIADHGTWTDAPTGYGYQAQISDDGLTGWTDIEGATTDTYTPVAGDEGKLIRFAVTATNTAGTSEPVLTNVTGAVAIVTFPPGAVAYWKMDEESGVRYDATGNGYDLTDNNSVGFGTGIKSNGANFAGTSGGVLTGAGVIIPNDSDFTVSYWEKLASYSDCWGFAITNSTGHKLTLDHGSGSPIRMVISQCENGSVNSTIGDLSLDVWNNVVAIRESGVIRFFVNGAAQMETFNTGAFVNSGGDQIAIGGNGSWSSDGILDEIGIWSRAVTDTEVAMIYNLGTGSTYQG